LQNRNIVIGGTSAEMAILGSHYFSAENGTVTSSAALSNPYAPKATIDSTPFLAINYLENVVTDTHYDDPDRKGRHMVFLARMFQDCGLNALGIACDECTAVLLELFFNKKTCGVLKAPQVFTLL
jgi:cyanophycinase-like exopeptidase